MRRNPLASCLRPETSRGVDRDEEERQRAARTAVSPVETLGHREAHSITSRCALPREVVMGVRMRGSRAPTVRTMTAAAGVLVGFPTKACCISLGTVAVAREIETDVDRAQSP